MQSYNANFVARVLHLSILEAGRKKTLGTKLKQCFSLSGVGGGGGEL